MKRADAFIGLLDRKTGRSGGYRWPVSLMCSRGGQSATVITVAVVVVVILSGMILMAPVDSESVEREVVISEGASAHDVARLLADEGIIRSAFVFSGYARLTGRATSLQAGRYVLCPCDWTAGILDAVASGKAFSDDQVVTIPEGMNIWEVDKLFSALGLSTAGSFVGAYLDNEGRYFPDTYRIGPEDGASELADRMYTTFQERATAYTDEQVIVASMLEKEAKTPEDMALVAGVIYRRLELGMALQIDATVAYGWCLRTASNRRSCDVTQAPIASELSVDGPYNTYARVGLPKGPISNPGARALAAAANPKTSDYLFYLSTRDGSRLIFAKTSVEHLRNRREHLGF